MPGGSSLPSPSFSPAGSTPPQAYFIGLEQPGVPAVTGYWVIPSQQHWAHGVSGTSSAFAAPEGTWYSTSGYLTTSENGMVEDTSLGRINHKVQFGILKKGAVAPPTGNVKASDLTRDFWDKTKQASRDGIAAHVDQVGGTGKESPVGTLGCFGARDSPAVAGLTPIQYGKNGKPIGGGVPYLDGGDTGTTDPAMLVRHQEAMKAVFQKPGVPLQVEHYKTQAEVEQRLADLTRDYDIWNKPAHHLINPWLNPPVVPLSKAGTDGVPMFDLLTGRPDVLVGPDLHPLSYAAPACTHEGGGCVIQGSSSVLVGKELFQVGREADPTSDGLLLQSDVESLRIGD
ncbi:MAG: hypothetical protein HOW73_29570 [Polyangiaceae bacterium]|nr:hypothetical protein [Polyangiaceae bacterium]